MWKNNGWHNLYTRRSLCLLLQWCYNFEQQHIYVANAFDKSLIGNEIPRTPVISKVIKVALWKESHQDQMDTIKMIQLSSRTTKVNTWSLRKQRYLGRSRNCLYPTLDKVGRGTRGRRGRNVFSNTRKYQRFRDKYTIRTSFLVIFLLMYY